jgi:hypothetical protein
MFFKMRKFATVILAVLPLLLSGCDVMNGLMDRVSPPIPPVNVTDVTTPAATPDMPPLYCNIGHGSALFGRDWYDFREVEFELTRGTPADVRLTRVHGDQQMTIQALFDGGGQKLIFCPFLNAGATAPDQRIACFSIYALEDDLHDGIRHTFDIPAAVRGGAITCAYTQEHLRSLATPAN